MKDEETELCDSKQEPAIIDQNHFEDRDYD
jgi:hypothetical protein